MQRVVYARVREEVMRLLGPDGPFAVTVRVDRSDGIFSDQVAETLAWEVAATIESSERPSARLL